MEFGFKDFKKYEGKWRNKETDSYLELTFHQNDVVLKLKGCGKLDGVHNITGHFITNNLMTTILNESYLLNFVYEGINICESNPIINNSKVLYKFDPA